MKTGQFRLRQAGVWKSGRAAVALAGILLLAALPAAAQKDPPKPEAPKPAKADVLKAAPVTLNNETAGPKAGANKTTFRSVTIQPNPKAATIALRSGDRALQRGDITGAARAYTEAVLAAPNEPMLRLPAGIMLSEARMGEAAADQFRKALTLAENDPIIALMYSTALADLGEGAKAQDIYMETCRRFALPGEAGGLDVTGSILRLRGAIKQFGDCPIYYLLLGDAYQLSARFPEADAAYRKASSLAPRWSKPLVNLGLSRLSQGKPDEAIRTFKSALDLDPRNKKARVQQETAIGSQYASNRDYPRAISTLNNAQRLSPKDPTPTVMIAQIETNNGNLPAAAGAFQIALNITRNGGLFSQRPVLFRSLAETWLTAKQPDKARETLLEALTEEPNSAPLWYRLLAQADVELGQPDHAQEMLKSALDSEPGPYPADTLRAIDSYGWMDTIKGVYERELASASGGVYTPPSASGAISITMAPPRSRAVANQVRPLVALAHIARYRMNFREEVRLRRELATLRNNPWDWFLMAETYDSRIVEPASAREAYLNAIVINKKGGGLNEATVRVARDRLSALTVPAYKPE